MPDIPNKKKRKEHFFLAKGLLSEISFDAFIFL
jgi:hypothetical protein